MCRPTCFYIHDKKVHASFQFFKPMTEVQVSFIGFYLTYDYTDIFESKFEGVTDDDIFYAESPKNQ